LEGSELAKAIKKGDRRALSKGITLVENSGNGAAGLLRMIRPQSKAFVLGITGPPGTGKSSLVDRLIGVYRSKGLKVGVVAVDPTSPITGGALLGDRVRMLAHSQDSGVFIRSMASRGWSGGLSRATSQVVRLLEAAGFDIILLETVGIGQSDIEVVGVSHAVIVVLMPGLGDDVQVSKAGLMEVGDVYVVNKADLDGADAMAVNLIGVMKGSKSRFPAVIKVSARTGEGIASLEAAIETIRLKFDEGHDDLRLKSLKGMILETARGNILERLGHVSDTKLETLARSVHTGRLTVEEAAAKLAA
jgi:GTPase